jgi:hypothetical protein
MILIRAAKIIQNAELQPVYLFFSVRQLPDLHLVKQSFFLNFSYHANVGCLVVLVHLFLWENKNSTNSMIHIAKTIS